jgi:hypothetical protein
MAREKAAKATAPDDATPGELLSRQLGEGEQPKPRRPWWKIFNRGTSTMMINQPGSGGGQVGGGF